MIVFNFDIKKNIKEKHFFKDGSILLLGEFETFHKGHEKLLKKAKELKTNEKIGILIIVKENENFQSLDNRLINLAKIGFDFVIVADFNFEFKSIEGDEFIKYLDQNFNVHYYFVGEDFKFGKDRKFSSQDLQSLTTAKSYLVDLEIYNDLKISSSDIKQMHEFGEYNIIKNLVVNPLEFDCEIIDKIIVWDKSIIKPHHGIYYFKLLLDDYWYHGIIHFTMNNLIDYYLINLEEDKEIFDQKTKIQILDIERIITNSRFDNINNEDKEKAKQYFSISD